MRYTQPDSVASLRVWTVLEGLVYCYQDNVMSATAMAKLHELYGSLEMRWDCGSGIGTYAAAEITLTCWLEAVLAKALFDWDAS